MAQLHALERRAAMAAGALKTRVSTMSQSLMAAQGRIPFHTKLSQANALDWWSQHRYDQLGQQALAGLDPIAVARLDTALTQHAQDKEALGLPVETDPTAMAAAGGALSG